LTDKNKFEQATRHIAEARRVVARQRRLIASEREAGRDTSHAELLLERFEKTLTLFEADLKSIQDERNAN
jgi:hypothetical protein